MSVVKLCANGKLEDKKVEEKSEDSDQKINSVSEEANEADPGKTDAVIGDSDEADEANAADGSTKVDPVTISSEAEKRDSLDEQLASKLDEISLKDEKKSEGPPEGPPEGGLLGDAIELGKKDDKGEITFSSPRRKGSIPPIADSSTAVSSSSAISSKATSKPPTAQPVESQHDLGEFDPIST